MSALFHNLHAESISNKGEIVSLQARATLVFVPLSSLLYFLRAESTPKQCQLANPQILSLDHILHKKEYLEGGR